MNRLLRIYRKLNRLNLPQQLLSISCMRLYELPLLPRSVNPSLRFETIHPDQFNSLATCRNMEHPEDGNPIFHRRHQRGSLCVGLFSGDRLVAFAWAKPEKNDWEDEDRYTLSMGAGGAYLFDTFIHPDWRGQNVYAVLLQNLQRRLQEEGIQRFFLLIDLGNERSIRAHKKLGVLPLETITCICLLGLRSHRATGNAGVYRDLHRFGSNSPFLSRLNIS